ncbi:Alanyl-tRNA synthetase [Giardia muris]|uniref:Alanine--tRNA ligase n=1 Tax=Giardia muris TaxID=5742 RepID=A0A4Z1TBU9_GIAMU|nr:Alanyl-tRNA synthetase [Giardia muris]|eukprot:TNJ30009.1 Alanyl-tRNA synthetase [Giardia muris]
MSPMALTAKEMKKVWRPRFHEEPERYYPTKVFEAYGYMRATCPKCGTLFWRRTETRTTCGDSECTGVYSFLQEGGSIPDETWSMKTVWESFKDSFLKTIPAHTVVSRYPVVARWRDDCDFTAAGIQCYQPFCVTGEVDPPANPLIQPQFCLRFNDLDSIGLSGRHYSGFTMLGIQVFNTPAHYVYFKDEIIDFNLRWLQALGINLDEVTLLADVWAGGGNLGPCVEYFIHGLEVGNMVFMEFKAFADGTLEPLPVQVVDVGIGLERIPWLLNRTVTSYATAFSTALPLLCDLLGVKKDVIYGPAWQKFGPYSCLLNIDEVSSLDDAWDLIREKSGLTSDEIRTEIEPVRDMYIVLDHLRALMVAIQDGALPSNVGGGSNLRNVLRRVFHLMTARGWWDKCGGIEGIMKIMDAHRHDLEEINGVGSFPPFRPLQDILTLEYARWQTTDKDARAKVERLLKKRGGALVMDDWITIVTTFGLDADQISTIAGTPVPGDLYSKIAEQQERNCAKMAQAQLYDTTSLPPTDCVYYTLPYGETMTSLADVGVVAILQNVEEVEKGKNLVILDKTVAYPTSGGQQNDTGQLRFYPADSKAQTYELIDVRKVGKCVVHVLDRAVCDQIVPGTKATVYIDPQRRQQLMCHHTAAHIIHASAHSVLGPHVWQAGAKKTVEAATLDITHYRGLTFEEERAIERHANRLVRSNIPISKYELPKSEAERRHGFSLYQGGVVPGSSVRCVDIFGTDTEACCGTHLGNTGKVGLIRIVKSSRISDGVVRLTFVAGERALDFTDSQAEVLHAQMTSWGVEQAMVVKTGEKFFTAMKHLEGLTMRLRTDLLGAWIDLALTNEKLINVFSVTDESPTLYLGSGTEQCLQRLVDEKGALKTSMAFIGETFVFILSSSTELLASASDIIAQVAPDAKTRVTALKNKSKGKKEKNAQVSMDNQQLMATGLEKKHTMQILERLPQLNTK